MAVAKLTSGMLAVDPIFYGQDWMLKINDDDGAVIVVRTYREPMDVSLRKRIRKIFRINGIQASIVDKNNAGITAFAPKFKGLRKYVEYTLIIHGPFLDTLQVLSKATVGSASRITGRVYG